VAIGSGSAEDMSDISDTKLGSRVMWLTAAATIIFGVGAHVAGVAAVWGGALVLLACHVPVLFGAWCIVGRLTNRPPDRPTSARELVLTGQGYFVCVIGLGLVLGNLGLLNLSAALASSCVLGLGLMWVGRRFAVPPFDRAGPSLLANAIRAGLLGAPVFVVWFALVSPTYEYDTLTYHLFFPLVGYRMGRFPSCRRGLATLRRLMRRRRWRCTILG
jgi:hypothetical protein